jgi:hypothetical protein
MRAKSFSAQLTSTDVNSSCAHPSRSDACAANGSPEWRSFPSTRIVAERTPDASGSDNDLRDMTASGSAYCSAFAAVRYPPTPRASSRINGSSGDPPSSDSYDRLLRVNVVRAVRNPAGTSRLPLLKAATNASIDSRIPNPESQIPSWAFLPLLPTPPRSPEQLRSDRDRPSRCSSSRSACSVRRS